MVSMEVRAWGGGRAMTSQLGQPVLQASAGGGLVPPPGAPALFFRGWKWISEQHQTALADRCLRISSLPAARRQVFTPSANKLGPGPGDWAFPHRPTGKDTPCARGFFHSGQGTTPHLP